MTAPGRYLLDTSVLIDVSKDVEPVSSLVRNWLDGPDEVGTCGVVVAELFAGLGSNEHPFWISFVDRLTFWNVTRPIAIHAGMVRHRHLRKGISLSTPDTLIAAVAISVGATLVTRNVKDFPMDGLSLFPLGQ
ncbi:MAG: type II toxin-antitoxin system VapC family toxin [Thermomicrobiales bacterium]